MAVQDLSIAILNSLQSLWFGFAMFIPSLIGAIIIIIIGLIFANFFGTVIEKVFVALKLDHLLMKLELEPYLERAGMKLRGARFLGRLTYWFIAIAFVVAAADQLHLTAFSSFLTDILRYIPNVVIAALIMLAAFVAANFIRGIIRVSVKGAKLHGSNFLGTLAWWSIVIFGILTALTQLNIATGIIQSIVTGFIAMLALAGGLAFGLGGRDYAAHLVNKLRDHTESKM